MASLAVAFQCLSNAAWYFIGNTGGLDSNDLALLTVLTMRPGVGAEGAAYAAGWEQVIEQAMSELEDGLRDLMAAGLPPPDEVGYELEQGGEVVAEAELVWMQHKVALLMPAHLDRLSTWEALGWRVVAANDEWKRLMVDELRNRSVQGDA